MFQKVLIANRGAIATRIIRTLKRLDMTAIAVYAESDRHSLHVSQADEAYSLGEGQASETYLNGDKLMAIARQAGAEAIHPGYGFLSENVAFVRQCQASGLVFIGPKAEHIALFGLKHKARELAQKTSVPLLPGTGLLETLELALDEADRIGYPVMLKSTAGGGGIGLQLCRDRQDLTNAFDSVRRLGANNFSDDGVFLEKYIDHARHIEVQVFGDGAGNALAMGERDCSAQRRNQKVVEECPAPHLPDPVRQQLHQCAERMLAEAGYENAGTVEFIVDSATHEAYFLEVNTRLQVEHGVTEEVFALDLVAWMLRQAAGERIDLDSERQALTPRGHAIQARLYAEDPLKNFQPDAGLLTQVEFPVNDGVRIDHWLEAGIDIPPYFDPLLAKVIVHADDREQALQKLSETLAAITLYGSQSNLGYLLQLCEDHQLQSGTVYTRYLDDFVYRPARLDVLHGGTQTTIQDFPGRRGYWDVGVPPSGPFDSYSFRLGNRILGNAENAAGLEIAVQGPSLQFRVARRIAITGADIDVWLDDAPIKHWEVIHVKEHQVLRFGAMGDRGSRAYLCVEGGIECPEHLGSRATFILGKFGGHNGRALRAGDVLGLSPTVSATSSAPSLHNDLLPSIDNTWEIRVLYGPHGAPDFLTDEDVRTFFEAEWEVHFNSSRTGVRLIGPQLAWARSDGGEAGLHPSNIHDNAYAFGTVDFTGDMPVILGPDGPSLGGFVCPATVIQADLWKLGQLRVGDTLRFVSVSHEHAVEAMRLQNQALAQMTPIPTTSHAVAPSSPVIAQIPADESGVGVSYRAAGDCFMLVEYGEHVLDISLRFRVHALMQWLQAHPLPGLLELTPGIRSLQIHYESECLDRSALIAHLNAAERALQKNWQNLSVASRIVHLPLSWDDEVCRQAIDKYSQTVRKNAPWCPSNLEFIRRINGLPSIDAVKDIVFSASYLVMGLGDVYLGAPVATPIDPRHRLVTTKYNPARTWTAENSVGIGGSYLCVYGMEGPGGYQFVGRTLQMWNRYQKTEAFEQPWLLRFFDQIRFYEVTADELRDIRRDFPRGQYPLTIEQSTFSLADYQQFLDANAAEIAAFSSQRDQAFQQELARWHAEGQFNFDADVPTAVEAPTASWPDSSVAESSPVSGTLWKTFVETGMRVETGQKLMIMESMKMEIDVCASVSGTVTHVLCEEGQSVSAGMVLVVVEPEMPS